jgi:hypothetical protein
MTQIDVSRIPAKNVNQPPKFRYAVLSLRKGADTAELESSFAENWKAESMFERQYSKWGLTDTSFYLVDWETQTILAVHPK